MLVVGDVDLFHDPRNVGRDTNRVGFDIGVVRRHHLAAGDIPVGSSNQGERQNGKQRPANPGPWRRDCTFWGPPWRFASRGRHIERQLRPLWLL
jgi:hypothetical protein